MGNESQITSPIKHAELAAEAASNAEKREKGTHVYHQKRGVITLEQAEAYIADGAKVTDFCGKPGAAPGVWGKHDGSPVEE